jgi:hypothetical protein
MSRSKGADNKASKMQHSIQGVLTATSKSIKRHQPTQNVQMRTRKNDLVCEDINRNQDPVNQEHKIKIKINIQPNFFRHADANDANEIISN